MSQSGNNKAADIPAEDNTAGDNPAGDSTAAAERYTTEVPVYRLVQVYESLCHVFSAAFPSAPAEPRSGHPLARVWPVLWVAQELLWVVPEPA